MAVLFWILERMLYIVCRTPLCCVVLAWGGVRHCLAALLSPGLLPGSRQLTLLSWSFSLSMYDGVCVVVGGQCSEDAASFRSERVCVLRLQRSPLQQLRCLSPLQRPSYGGTAQQPAESPTTVACVTSPLGVPFCQLTSGSITQWLHADSSHC